MSRRPKSLEPTAWPMPKFGGLLGANLANAQGGAELLATSGSSQSCWKNRWVTSYTGFAKPTKTGTLGPLAESYPGMGQALDAGCVGENHASESPVHPGLRKQRRMRTIKIDRDLLQKSRVLRLSGYLGRPVRASMSSQSNDAMRPQVSTGCPSSKGQTSAITEL